MAKQENGYLGGFSGKLGPAVGYRWKGVWCLRSQPRRVYNPRTELQQVHRAMFKEEVRLAGKMRWAVNIGFKALSDELDMTAQNLFVKANQQAFSMAPTLHSDKEAESRLEVDYSQLRISGGPVAPVVVSAWSIDTDNVLNVNFEKNPLHLSCNSFDNVYVWVWCPEAGVGYLTNPVYRRMKQLSSVLPSLMEGKEVHVYAFVQDEHGRCSNTAYAVQQSDTLQSTPATETQHDASQDNTKTRNDIGEMQHDASLQWDQKCSHGHLSTTAYG